MTDQRMLSGAREGKRVGRGGWAVRVGGGVLGLMVVICVGSLWWTTGEYNRQELDQKLMGPVEAMRVAGEEGGVFVKGVMGTDRLGRSVLARMGLGGAISLGIGLAAAGMSVLIGTVWGMTAGYVGGRVDAVMMRMVDVMYGLPYILLVVLLSVALQPWLARRLGVEVGNVVTLLVAIGAVSWLTLARVVRGQVLSLRGQGFVEAARACGVPGWRVMLKHILPNLVGPIVVYTTLTVPQAILQESFLSFLGIGVHEPVPSWGNMAAAGLAELNPVASHWWLLVWPCVALGLTLGALNYVGDGLREVFDPRFSKR